MQKTAADLQSIVINISTIDNVSGTKHLSLCPYYKQVASEYHNLEATYFIALQSTELSDKIHCMVNLSVTNRFYYIYGIWGVILLDKYNANIGYLDDSLDIDNNEFNKNILYTIMNNSQDTFYFKDKYSRIIIGSKAHSALWGEDNPKDVIGKTDFDYFPEEFARTSFEAEQEIMKTQTPILGMIEKLIKPDGSVMWLSASKYPLYDSGYNIIGTWGTSRDITSLKEIELELARLNESLEEANRKLKILSCKDTLTGLYNQGHFMEETKKVFELFKRREEKVPLTDFSIIIFDVDNLKGINDTYGHLMGDYVLRYISDVIATKIRSSDKFFRIGGDEFGLLLLDTNIEDAKIIAEKIRETVAKTNIKYMDNKISITVSLGVSTFKGTDSIEDMIHTADERLYQSKREGKNKIY